MEVYFYYTLAFSVLITGLAIFIGYKLFQYRRSLQKYSKIIDVESEAKRIKTNAEKLKDKYLNLTKRHENLTKLVGDLEQEEFLSEYGLYKPKYDFGSSEEYKKKLDEIRAKQKEMISRKIAAVCNTTWTVGNSKREGQKMVNRTLKMALNAYNVECDNLILKVKHNNIDRIYDRIDKLLERIEKFLEPMNSYISKDFHNLKHEELDLVFRYNEKLQEEKEEQREIREQMREEEKARKEIEAAQKKAEKEEVMYQKALEKAKKDLEQSSDDERDKMLKQIEELENNLKEAHESKERALSMAQQTKRGHVYIVSNIGSFGENVYKIGMTRRLEPMDRVGELSGASVPFPFDVHAMIFSENAPELENELHKHFNDNRLNKVNNRKEYFKVPLVEIESFCHDKGEKIEFTKKADAHDYYQTLKINEQLKTAEKSKDSTDQDESLDFDLDVDAA